MGSKLDLEQKVFEGLAGRQASHELRERGQYDRWENRRAEEFKKVEHGRQNSAEGQQSWQRKPLLDQKRGYYNTQGIPPPDFQNEIANSRKRYAMNMVDTEPQAPSSPKKARLSADWQTEAGEMLDTKARKTQAGQTGSAGEQSKKKLLKSGTPFPPCGV